MSAAELQVQELLCRLEAAESKIEMLLNPPSRIWMTPQEIEEYTNGKYKSSQIIRICKQAIEKPADLPFKLGDHLVYDDTDRGRFFRVNYPEFDRITIELMRNSA